MKGIRKQTEQSINCINDDDMMTECIREENQWNHQQAGIGLGE